MSLLSGAAVRLSGKCVQIERIRLVFQHKSVVHDTSLDQTAGDSRRVGILKSIYGKTSAEVAEKLREATASVDAGTYIEPQRMTLAAWLDIWTQEYCGDVKPGTLDDYKGHIENHIKPALGAIRLCELQPIRYNKLRKKG